MNTKSLNLYTVAANTIGADNMKEYFAADSLSTPNSLPVVIVTPERDTPGINAKACDNPIKNVLIVDDSILSGRALNDAKTLLKESKIDKKFNLIYCCIYATSKMISNIDRYAELVRPPRLFQWNYLNHPHSVHWCYDIDGVL